jgi:hypothetical protein
MKLSINKTYALKGGIGPKNTFKPGHFTGPHIVISGPRLPSVRVIKRLAEIAAMDAGQIAEELPAGIGNLTYFQLVSVVEHVRHALGLSPKNSKKAGRKAK